MMKKSEVTINKGKMQIYLKESKYKYNYLVSLNGEFYMEK